MSSIEKTFSINGYDIHAHFDSDIVENLFLPLIARLRKIQKEKQRRIVVFLAAPPGVGKTTLSMFLEYLSTLDGKERIQAIGIDGFHHYQSYLMEHSMIRFHQRVAMVSLKGCPETFDIKKLQHKLIQLTKDDFVKWPLYIRSLHNPCEDQIDVTKNIVILEGNYVLLKDEGWCDLRQYCDYSMFISTKLPYIEDRLIKRKMMGGTSQEDAYAFFKRSDAYNAEYILSHSQKADITYHMKEDGSYQIEQ